MANTVTTGRIVGILMLTQWICGLLVNAVLTRPLFGEPGFLIAAHSHSNQIAISVLLGLFTGVLAVVIAVTAYPVFRRSMQTLAMGYVALSGVSFAVTSVEQISVMSMVSLSDAYAAAASAESAAFEGLRTVVASARNWAHYTALLAGSITLLAFYLNLLRSAAAPRVLGAAGIAAVLLQMGALVTPFFGRDVMFVLLAPIGITQLVVALWLVARGFRVVAGD